MDVDFVFVLACDVGLHLIQRRYFCLCLYVVILQREISKSVYFYTHL